MSELSYTRVQIKLQLKHLNSFKSILKSIDYVNHDIRNFKLHYLPLKILAIHKKP